MFADGEYLALSNEWLRHCPQVKNNSQQAFLLTNLYFMFMQSNS